MKRTGITRRQLAQEFQAGRSSVGLARKYGVTSLEAQEAVRKVMRRGAPLKRGTRVNPVSAKTRTMRWPVLKALRTHVLARAHGRCEYTAGTDHGGPLDCDHVVNRSQKRDDDPSNAVLLCRHHHDAKVRPFSKGRLVIEALGGERFRFITIFADDKWTIGYCR
jgi:hypothetical protein